METVRARWHRRLGGFLCRIRGRHNLVLAEHHWLERTGVRFQPVGEERLVTMHEMERHSERRPWCTTCWQMPAD